jgi:hypothetical protein
VRTSSIEPRAGALALDAPAVDHELASPRRSWKRLSVLALALTQGVQLCRVQGLRDVRDQIARLFDADRQPDRAVENPYFLAEVSRNAGVGHACRQAGKRFGAAQAHRQLEDLQCVQEFEGGGLAADNVERERRARAGALPRKQPPLGEASSW